MVELLSEILRERSREGETFREREIGGKRMRYAERQKREKCKRGAEKMRNREYGMIELTSQGESPKHCEFQ